MPVCHILLVQLFGLAIKTTGMIPISTADCLCSIILALYSIFLLIQTREGNSGGVSNWVSTTMCKTWIDLLIFSYCGYLRSEQADRSLPIRRPLFFSVLQLNK